MTDYLEVLRRVELLMDLDDASLADIAAGGEEIVVPRDGVIYHRGDVGTHFFIVLEGRVRVVIADQRAHSATTSDRRARPSVDGDGKDHRVNPVIAIVREAQPSILLKTHTPGGFFGEMSLLTGDPVSADVIASEDTRLLSLTKQVFEATCTQHPSILLYLNRILSRYIASTNVMVSKPRLARLNVIHRVGDDLRNSFVSLYLASSVVQQTNKRVILVDCESTLEAPLRCFAPVSEQDASGVFDTRHTFATLSDFRAHCVVLGECFHVLTFPEPLSQTPGIEWSRLRDLLEVICRLYDVVIIDTGDMFDLRAARMLALPDKIYLLAASNGRGHVAVKRLLKELDPSPSNAAMRLRIGLVGDFDFARPSSILEPLVAATGIKNVFLLAAREVNEVRMSPDLLPVIDKDSPTGRRLDSMAREIAGCRIGIALGAGGAKGFAHIGIWRVIEQIQLPVDVIVGCSMGAIIGAAFALGKTSHETEQMMRRLWTPKGAFFDWQIPPRTNIVKGRKVDRMNNEAYGDASILDCVIPYASLAFDLITGQEVVIDEGTIKNAVRASGSMPVIMRPVKWKNHYLIDGGVTNVVPVNVLAGMGTDFNIAVNVAPEIDPSFYDLEKMHPPGLMGMMTSLSRNARKMFLEPSIFQIISRWYSTSSTKITELHLPLAHVVMRPDTGGIGTLDWHKFDEAIASGATCAQQHAEEIKAKLSALRGY